MSIYSKVLPVALTAAAAAVLTACGGGGGGHSSAAKPTIACSFQDLPLEQLAYEERRLTMPLPYSGANVVGNDSTPFATRILADTGFDVFAPAFADTLCKDGKTELTTYEDALAKVKEEGVALWRAAVDRVQGRRASPEGSKMPNSEDRMLYWARVQMTKVLRQWKPDFTITADQADELQWEFERSSRGQYDMDFPTGTTPDGKKYRRMIVSGFDVFTLGTPPSASNPTGTIGTGIRNGNPSGATALEMDGREYTLSDGSILHVEAYMLPVSYPPFHRGMQEDTLGPWFKEGPKRVDASISMSQGGSNQFWIEQWNGRGHGQTAGNDGQRWCYPGAGQSPYLPSLMWNVGDTVPDDDSGPIAYPGAGCDINPPARWLGYDSQTTWMKDYPPQFIHTTLPAAALVTGNSQAGVPRPAGATSQGTDGFDVTYHTNYTYFPDCTVRATVSNPTTNLMNTMPDLSTLLPIDPAWCAYSGGGGSYLSNESAYRNTLLRDVFKLDIPAGHIHIPVMNNYHSPATTGQPRDDNALSDSRYEAYRTAIVEQSRRLAVLVGESLTFK